MSAQQRRSPFGMRRSKGDDSGPRASFKELLPFLAEHKATLIAVALLSIVGAGTTLAQPLLVGRVISDVEAGNALGGLVWAIVALIVVSSLISAYQHYLLQRTGTAVVYSSRRKLIARILHLPIADFDSRRTGDLVSRVGTDTTLLYAVLTQGLADAFGNALIFIGALIAMALIDPILLLLIVAVMGLSLLLVVTLSGRIRKATAAQQEKVGELASGVERAISSIRTVRASGADQREVKSIDGTAREAYFLGVRVAKVSAFIMPIAGIAVQLSLLVVLGVGCFRVASDALTISQLVTFIMFLFLLVQPLGSFFGAITSVNQALGALGRIKEVLDLPEENAFDEQIAAEVLASGYEQAPDGVAPALSFKNVSFHYPEQVITARAAGTDAALRAATAELVGGASAELQGVKTAREGVLEQVSFDVPRGARVALVGPSGAGKSTVLALIERFYDVNDGAIELDGIDLRLIERERLRAELGYVEQDAPTLAGTIADNLRLASPDATDADCERVLREVNLGEVLERNPEGIYAQVGEGGVMLSGGERQRLAIARALLAAHSILLLDESTSSLDGVNEQRMREAIDAVAKGRTLVVIAHRLSTVVDSDLIVVLDQGRVVGQGTHSELVKTVPLYRDLAKHQLLV